MLGEVDGGGHWESSAGRGGDSSDGEVRACAHCERGGLVEVGKRVTWQYLQLRLSWQWLDLAAEARTTVAMCSWVTVGKLWDLSVPQFPSISYGSHSSMYLIGFP